MLYLGVWLCNFQGVCARNWDGSNWRRIHDVLLQ
jgi:hypothetical protein